MPFSPVAAARVRLSNLVVMVLAVGIVLSATASHAAELPSTSSAESLVEQLMMRPAGLDGGSSEAKRAKKADRPQSTANVPARPASATTARSSDREEGAKVFAEADGTELVLPGRVRTVGFHESGGNTVALQPAGRLTENLNTSGEAPSEASGDSTVPYMVLPSRNRGGGATTAVDLSMAVGEQVTSPVTGTVTGVHEYSLYGKTPDLIIEIRPEGRADQLVRVLHVEGAAVEAGDEVVAGETPVAAGPRKLPFGSQIDRFSGLPTHVHIAVHPAG